MSENLPGPYPDDTTNLFYNMLFCDDLELYKATVELPYSYPFDILFAENFSPEELQNLANDPSTEPRIRLLGYQTLRENGYAPVTRDLLAVIVEVGLDEGLDVLASYSNGTARYINHTGKILIWETTDQASLEFTKDLFTKSAVIVQQIGPWDKARLAAPPAGNLRISFLVSDGLYFGEGPVNALFNDAMAGPALMTATQLMQYITDKALETGK